METPAATLRTRFYALSFTLNSRRVEIRKMVCVAGSVHSAFVLRLYVPYFCLLNIGDSYEPFTILPLEKRRWVKGKIRKVTVII